MKAKKEGVSRKRYSNVTQCKEVKTGKMVSKFENGNIFGNLRQKFTKVMREKDYVGLQCKYMLKKSE